MFSKSLETVLSALALLAEVYDNGNTSLTAEQIAERQQLNKPFVAKLLTALSGAGIVASKPGRHGGFSLARAPEQIQLAEIASAIGYRAKIECCPFGPDYGKDRPHGHCALHDQVCALRDQVMHLLENNTLAGFAAPSD